MSLEFLLKIAISDSLLKLSEYVFFVLNLKITICFNRKGNKKAPQLLERLLSAVWTGLEPATSCVTGRHSNQLNYQTKMSIVPIFITVWMGPEPATFPTCRDCHSNQLLVRRSFMRRRKLPDQHFNLLFSSRLCKMCCKCRGLNHIIQQ